MPRKLNRKLANSKSKRYKKGFRKPANTNSLYRNSIPRTLQVATRRPTTATLRFVKNMTFHVKPNINADGTNNMFHLQIRANAIKSMISDYYPEQTVSETKWVEQDQDYALVGTGTGLDINAEGFEDWRHRFHDYTVLGSKIQCSYEPVINTQGSAASFTSPTTLILQQSQAAANGVDPAVDDISDIVKLPNLSRAQILQARVGRGGQGARLYSFFSAKKAFGVKDVMDNTTLGGNFNIAGTPGRPSKAAFYNIYIAETVPVRPGAVEHPCVEGILRVKVEYITKLTVETSTNEVSQGGRLDIDNM